MFKGVSRGEVGGKNAKGMREGFSISNFRNFACTWYRDAIIIRLRSLVMHGSGF